ncbi:DUF4012 domain-containing protein [Microtetraspora sp. NBRC 16547]|uniref:DUF4012 domain-containing protein n=1 Tax=Microtetraspora sp. NBRC 16547 TaxID=3030993 RepID=UPI0024A1702A|nr:DUF4012 domain-containing protein [Microtetraspora sp. NBRC 16547]GLW96949.1 hypothetical protein Misp02_10360 [Microtetraspora sp. NBRC 16547]
MALIGLSIPAAGLVLAGGWSAHLGLSVRDHLEAAKNALLPLSSDDPRQLAGPLAEARRHAAEARRLTSGPDWWLLAHAPFVGDAATTTAGLAEAADELTDVLGGVYRTATPFMTANAVSMSNIRQLLDGLGAAAPVLDDGVARLATVRSLLAATPADTGVDLLDQARDTALREIDRLHGRLGQAADAAALLPPMLGHDGPRRYFLAFQTNAEARGTGGLVGAFGILKADHGKLGIDRLSADNGLGSPRPVVDHGAAFQARYGPSATSLLSVSNLSPHFPYAAATWAGLWERRYGRRLDGAIATDPVGLSYLLGLIGPVTLPDGETITADNVVDLTERAAYARYPDPMERKRFLITVAGAVSDAVSRSLPEPARLLPVLSRLVDERRIQIWSRHLAEEQRLAATPLGGELPRRPGPFAGLVVNNSAGGKLDYYLRRSLSYSLDACRDDGLRATTVRVRLGNDVPRGALPDYVTARLDSPGRHHAPGSNLLWVSLYATQGARLSGVRLDGHKTAVIIEAEQSHPVYSTLLEFAPRQSRTLEFTLLEPVSAQPPAAPVQPLVRPQHTRITEDHSGCPTSSS